MFFVQCVPVFIPRQGAACLPVNSQYMRQLEVLTAEYRCRRFCYSYESAAFRNPFGYFPCYNGIFPVVAAAPCAVQPSAVDDNLTSSEFLFLNIIKTDIFPSRGSPASASFTWLNQDGAVHAYARCRSMF